MSHPVADLIGPETHDEGITNCKRLGVLIGSRGKEWSADTLVRPIEYGSIAAAKKKRARVPTLLCPQSSPFADRWELVGKVGVIIPNLGVSRTWP